MEHSARVSWFYFDGVTMWFSSCVTKHRCLLPGWYVCIGGNTYLKGLMDVEEQPTKTSILLQEVSHDLFDTTV